MLKAGAELVSFDLPWGPNSISRKQHFAVLKNTLNIFISVKKGNKRSTFWTWPENECDADE